MSGVGFEPTPPFGDQNARSHCLMGRYYYHLESGALDRSAILTTLRPLFFFLKRNCR